MPDFFCTLQEHDGTAISIRLLIIPAKESTRFQ
jgi:hypothetical protein